jgi:hypothetical protein
MARKIETVCGHSCSDCGHHGKECPGCGMTGGRPFWTAFVETDCCPVYDCCVTERKLPHCGRCPELMCERFTRFRDPDMGDEQAEQVLGAMERELRVWK